MKTASHSIVEPLLNLLRSLNLEVQDGGEQRGHLKPHGDKLLMWLHCLTSSAALLSLCIFLAAVNLILDLRCYDVRPVLLSSLVALLRPAKEEEKPQQITEGDLR